MNIRIQETRKSAKMTQDEFAETLGVSKNYVWMIEKGSRTPSQRTLKDICQKFKVNYEWLVNGTGEMFIQNKRKAEIAEFLGTSLSGEPSDFRFRLIDALSQLDEKDLELIAQLAISLAKKNQ